MKEDQDYIRDITQMRTMMERSSKFLSLSGLAGIMAGVYGLAGAYFAYKVYGFSPKQIVYDNVPRDWLKAGFVAIIVLILAIGTGILLSYRNAYRKHEKFWDPTAWRVLISMSVPLIAGAVLIFILISKGLIGLVAPVTLIFYGMAQYNASKHTYGEMKSLGIIHIVLGLVSAYWIEYGLLCWALGFGVIHIIYGIYLHYRHER
jgi:hypothetical protein